MLVKNGDIWQAHPALKELCKEPWPVKTAYWLAKLSRKLGGHYADVEKVRNDLILRYGSKNEQGVPMINPTSPNWQAFAADYEELMGQECEVAAEVITLPDSEIRVTPDVLLALEPFVSVA